MTKEEFDKLKVGDPVWGTKIGRVPLLSGKVSHCSEIDIAIQWETNIERVYPFECNIIKQRIFISEKEAFLRSLGLNKRMRFKINYGIDLIRERLKNL